VGRKKLAPPARCLRLTERFFVSTSVVLLTLKERKSRKENVRIWKTFCTIFLLCFFFTAHAQKSAERRLPTGSQISRQIWSRAHTTAQVGSDASFSVHGSAAGLITSCRAAQRPQPVVIGDARDSFVAPLTSDRIDSGLMISAATDKRRWSDRAKTK